jgi:hypothetical protein
VGGSRGERDHHSLDEGTARRLGHPFVEVRQRVQVQGRRCDGRKLPRLINQKRERTEKYAAQRGIAGGAIFHPDPGKTEHAHREKNNRKQLHQHIAHFQADQVRQQSNPLMGQRRISGLGKTTEPFFVPRLEPMMGIVRGEEDVEIGVERAGWKLHRQQGPLDRERHQHDGAKRKRPGIGCCRAHHRRSAALNSIAPVGFTNPPRGLPGADVSLY